MSIQIKQYVVEHSVAAVNFNAKKDETVSSCGDNAIDGKQQKITASARNANARFDSYIASGAYGFLAMKL